jgi:hypothetical protein
MARSGRPPLLRASRACFALGAVALVVLVLYIGSAAYYATRVTSPGTAEESARVLPGQILQVGATVNLSNPGPFPISGLTLAGTIELPNGSAWGTGSSPPVSLTGGSTLPVTLAVNLFLPMLAGASDALLVNSSDLPFQVWVNGTYAALVGVALEYNASYHWGAPFAGLNVGFGSPTAYPNGTFAIPATVAFTNDAPIGLDGNATVSIVSTTGQVCGGLFLPVHAPSHAPYQGSATMYLPSGCSLSGAAYHLAWSGMGFSVSLPGGTLP